MRRLIPTFCLIVIALASCQNNQDNGRTVGAVGGAAAGGVVGSQIGKGNGQLAAVGVGVLLGGWIGNQIGGELDDTDRQKNRQAERRAYTAQVGQQVTWNNPDSGVSGTITPIHEGYSNSGVYCRDFQQTVIVEGQKRQGTDKACQQPDGSWKITP